MGPCMAQEIRSANGFQQVLIPIIQDRFLKRLPHAVPELWVIERIIRSLAFGLCEVSAQRTFNELHW